MKPLVLGASAVLGLGLGGACSDRDPDDVCYERNAALDWEGPVELTPFCDWEPASEPFPEPPSEYANTWTVFVTFEPSDAMPCDPCDLERFDALLHAEIEAQCDQPYVFVRGCHVPADEDGNRCQVAGLYHTNCQAPTKD